MIQLTEKAAKQIVEISNAEGIGHFIIRAKIVGGGCAGFIHDLCFDDKISDMDELIEFNDYYGTVKVVIDPLSFQYLDGVTIDWVDGPFGSGFKFNNPNITGSCGCGSSFSF